VRLHGLCPSLICWSASGWTGAGIGLRPESNLRPNLCRRWGRKILSHSELQRCCQSWSLFSFEEQMARR
jgi:hypothetical protein